MERFLRKYCEMARRYRWDVLKSLDSHYAETNGYDNHCNTVNKLMHHVELIQTVISKNRPLLGPIKQCEKVFFQNGTVVGQTLT